MTKEEAEAKAAEFGNAIAEAEDTGDEDKRRHLRAQWTKWRNQFAKNGDLWWASYRAYYRQYEKPR